MKRTVIILLALFLVFGLYSAVSAAPEPSPAPSPGIGADFNFNFQSLDGLFMPAFTAPGVGATKLTLNPAELNSLSNMTVGGFVPVSFNLPPTYTDHQLIWTSSNPDVANVTSFKNRALIHGKAPGTAVITVRTADGRFSYSFTVVVK